MGGNYGPLAQLVRAPHLQCGGRRFESGTVHNDFSGQFLAEVAGSNPVGSTIISSTEEVEFLFYEKVAYLLYALAILWRLRRFELWRDHLVNSRSVKKFCGLD